MIVRYFFDVNKDGLELWVGGAEFVVIGVDYKTVM